MSTVGEGQALFGEATHFVSHSRREEFALLVDGLERCVPSWSGETGLGFADS